jgi:hypothetical protein
MPLSCPTAHYIDDPLDTDFSAKNTSGLRIKSRFSADSFTKMGVGSSFGPHKSSAVSQILWEQDDNGKAKGNED